MYGLYTTPLNDDIVEYKGLYRMNPDIFNIKPSEEKTKSILKTYIEKSREGIFVDDNALKIEELIALYNFLKNADNDVELVYFSKFDNEVEQFERAGFDIVANSLSYSPLGDNFLDCFDKQAKFDSFLGEEKFNFYKSNLNENKLFNNICIAKQFAIDCNNVSKAIPHAIESEYFWFPVMISIYRD